MESGDILKLNPQQVRDFYCQQTQTQISELRKRCLQYQIDLVEVDIDNPFQDVLTPWFVKRGKMK
jgi:alanine-alpha-ketoisovalerate/valine-pyruvate aminotransferase